MLTEIHIDETRVIARLDDLGGRVQHELRKVVETERLILEALIKRKLSGEVLNVVTGNLRRSVASHTEDAGASVYGVAIQSGDVKYGARWEYGFSGTETVAAHTRTVTQAFGEAIAPTEIRVQTFTRTANSPARSFMRSSLADRSAAIVAALKGAVARGLAP